MEWERKGRTEGEKGLGGRIEKSVEKHGGKKREWCKVPRSS